MLNSQCGSGVGRGSNCPSLSAHEHRDFILCIVEFHLIHSTSHLPNAFSLALPLFLSRDSVPLRNVKLLLIGNKSCTGLQDNRGVTGRADCEESLPLSR